MTEVCAAMGLTSLESLDEFIDVNRRNYQDYRLALDGMPGIHLMRYEETERCNYQYVILEVDEQITGVSRDQMVHILHAENILARRYFYPGCHNMEPYRSYFPHAGLMLPETERIAKRLMALPTGTAVGPGEIAVVCDIIQLIVKQGSYIRQRLPS
jgi:dTDP-4-amino-4,6-dideoxygalactose transaminase